VIYDIYSKRKNADANTPDVYQYDDIPEQLRVQIAHLWRRHFEDKFPSGDDNYQVFYKIAVQKLCEEYGLFHLNDARQKTHRSGNRYDEELRKFLLEEQDTDRVLDAVELAFNTISNEEANQDLNTRFKEHGVGYEYVDNRIFRIDSQYIHKETVVPALVLLGYSSYSGAEMEFLEAHKNYRHQDYSGTLNECLKAMESTLKIICNKRGWAYNQKDTAKKLLDICFDNELIPSFWQSHFSALRSCLESGVPTGRNKLSGHGQGDTPTEIPQHIASFVLHETATNIKFLVEAERSLV